MGYVKSGNKTRVFDSTVMTVDDLPVGVYDISYNDMEGFSLLDHGELPASGKVYGDSYKKVDKVMNAFKNSERNFGVLLSGPKGSGKSIFTRLVCEKALADGYPVVLSSEYYPGIAHFIGSIHNQVIVLFDEFDKHFAVKGDAEIQNELLSLFDGTDCGKKLFLCTCNELEKINEYFISRPGRFHYHLTTKAPGANEVREYLSDNLSKEYYVNDVVNKITGLAAVNNFTYDILRAIVFELNMGYSLSDAMSDLNISVDNSGYYTLIAKLANGMTIKLENNYSFDIDEEDDYVLFRPTTYGEDLKFEVRVYPQSLGDYTEKGYKIVHPDANTYWVHKKINDFDYKYIFNGTMDALTFNSDVTCRLDDMDQRYDWAREVHNNLKPEDFVITEAYLVPNPGKYSDYYKKIKI